MDDEQHDYELFACPSPIKDQLQSAGFPPFSCLYLVMIPKISSGAVNDSVCFTVSNAHYD